MTSPEPQAARTPKRVRIHHLQQWKDAGERWPMLTAYDFPTARVFDEAGIPVLLVGDSAANNMLGYDSTVPVSVDELLMLTKAVVRGTSRALVVADLPFGSYQVSAAQALETAVRFFKEGGAAAVKLEGGAQYAGQIRALTDAGIPVMAHLGFTPQSEHALGGFRVQGRGAGAEKLIEDALRRAGGGRVRGGARDGPGRRREARERRAPGPDHRDRRGPGHRRAGARVARHGRAQHRADAAVRQALRGPGRRAGRGGRAVRPGGP